MQLLHVAVLVAVVVASSYLPLHGSRLSVAVVRGLAVVVALWLLTTVFGREYMSNYGDKCPNGFVMNGDECVPVGEATYRPPTSP